ncbi:MAG: hypothetical protein MPW15_24175 [Candidatus Manganitrophus sp.]|nr:hypothetical protein [Candidatus Manganitrophus sp.]
MPHDTVPYTAQVVTEGNPPGQTIQVAIDAGQTLSFQMPYDLDLSAVKMINGGTHTTGGGFNFRAESVARRLRIESRSDRQSSQARRTKIRALRF